MSLGTVVEALGQQEGLELWRDTRVIFCWLDLMGGWVLLWNWHLVVVESDFQPGKHSCLIRAGCQCGRAVS